MIGHLFTLIWNRRRTNALLMVEIAVSFLLLCALSTIAVFFWRNYQRPLGFHTDQVWRVTMKLPARTTAEGPDARNLVLSAAVQSAVRALPEVVAAAGLDVSPYEGGRSTSSRLRRNYYVSGASDELPAVFGIELLRGRWFAPEDEGADYIPVVVNQSFAAAHFGAAEVVGQRFDHERRDGKSPREKRVVGLVRDYRQDGELGRYDAPVDMVFRRWQWRGAHAETRPPHYLVIKLRPGTTVAFEPKLMAAMHAAAPNWSFVIHSYDSLRRAAWRQTLAPLAVLAIVAGFLLVMVALGLCGVVWQNVTQRTREIGLRRAKGATAGDIRRQLLGELLVMATIAMAAAGVIAAHVPVLGLLDDIAIEVYLMGFAISVLSIYVLVIVASHHPARLATKVQPFQALRYE